MAISARFPPPAYRLLPTLAWCLGVGTVLAILIGAALGPHHAYFDAQAHMGSARALLAGESPYTGYLQKPLWAALLLAPFAALPDAIAYSALFAANIAAWLTAAWLLWSALAWPASFPARALAVGLLAVFPPVVWSTRGQLDGFMALGLALFLVLAAKRPWLAGAALSLLSLKPHLGFLLVVLLAVWSLRAGRREVAASLLLTLAVLAAVSFLLWPAWLFEWVAEVLTPPPDSAARRGLFSPLPASFLGLLVPHPVALTAAAVLAVGVFCLTPVWVWRKRPAPALVAAVGAPATFLVTPYAQGYDLSLVVFALGFLAARLSAPPSHRRRAYGAAILFAYALPVTIALTHWPQPLMWLCAALPLVILCAFEVTPWGRSSPVSGEQPYLSPSPASPAR